MAANLTRNKLDYNKKLHHSYEVTLSKIAARDAALRNSVLGYAGRARNNKWAEPKHENLDSLVVQAKHIPRFRTVQPNRRPASLDELLGKHAQSIPRDKPRSASKISLPALPERLSKRSHDVKISFVSASDLYDIVDFSIRNKDKKEDAITLKQEEAGLVEDKPKERQPQQKQEISSEGGQAKSRREKEKKSSKSELFVVSVAKEQSVSPNKDQTVEEKSDNLKIDTKDISVPSDNERKQKPKISGPELDLKSLLLESIKSRPSRAKRMQLRQPLLNIIPENDVISNRTASAKTEVREVTSPPPKQSPRNIMIQNNLSAIPEYDMTSSIEQLLEKKRVHGKRPEVGKVFRTGGGMKLEPLNGEMKNETHQLKTKMKAQKKIKRLIYLRDMPEKHYQRTS